MSMFNLNGFLITYGLRRVCHRITNMSNIWYRGHPLSFDTIRTVFGHVLCLVSICCLVVETKTSTYHWPLMLHRYDIATIACRLCFR